MRRKDKEITEVSVLEHILSNAQICRIGFSDHNIPYIVPVNYGYHDHKIYIHSAKSGRKIELIRRNPNICFEVELQAEIITGPKACDWTTKYRSVIGYGRIEIIDDASQKKDGLDIIMKQHDFNGQLEYKEALIKKMYLLLIHIESMTGKQSGNW